MKNFIVGYMKKSLKFIREGWFWILLPTLIAAVLIGGIIVFGDPYLEGALHGKFILLYSFFGD